MFRAHFFDAVDDRSSIIVAIGDSHSIHRHQTSLLPWSIEVLTATRNFLDLKLSGGPAQLLYLAT
jgi:hypothetical protein